MPTTINLDRTLDSGELEFLCGVARPCITLLLAPYKPGEPTPPDWVQIRQLIRGSAELPEMRALGKEAEPLLAPLLYLEDQPELEKGGKGLAVFSAPGFVSAYRSDSIAGQRIVVSARAYIKPLLAETLAPREIFILGLSRKHLRLLRYRMGKCEEMPLPAGVPASVNEAVALDKPDHNFQNQVSAGPSTGDISGVRFGTGSDRETAPEYLHQFFTLVDQGLQPVVGGAPLLLMGVAEEVAAYRKAAPKANLIAGEFDGREQIVSLDQAGQHAKSAALALYRGEGERALGDFREMNERHRTLNSVPEIVAAAEEGRVHRLILAEDLEIDAANSHPDAMKGDDLLNAAAVETIKTRGQVFALPAERMGSAAPAAAILRY